MPSTSPTLMPFEEALQALARRKALPTNLSSAQLRELGAEFHRNALVSSRNNVAGAMDAFKNFVGRMLNPTTEQRADRITPENPQGNVSVGIDRATAELKIRDYLREQGYRPNGDEAGTITDLQSRQRIKLFVDTNVQLSRGRGWFIQSQDPATIDAFPAQELVRIESRQRQRDWSVRFLAAAQAVGDIDAIRVFGETGRMIARKDSPLWQALGDGAGGFESDALGNPHEPFAFNSGMGLRDIAYTEAVRIGLIQPGTKVQPQVIDLGELFNVEKAA